MTTTESTTTTSRTRLQQIDPCRHAGIGSRRLAPGARAPEIPLVATDPHDTELRYLRRCVELAAEALEAGDEPFTPIYLHSSPRTATEVRVTVSAY
jgi:hypothetical protein